MIRQFYDGYGEHFKCIDGSDFRYPPANNQVHKDEKVLCKTECSKHGLTSLNDIFSGFKADDIILLGLIAFLIYDGVDDYILLIILGIILVMGLGDKEC